MIKTVIAQFLKDHQRADQLGQWEVDLEEPGVEAQLKEIIRGEALCWGVTGCHLAEVLANTTHGLVQTKQDLLLIWFELSGEDADKAGWIRIIAYATDPAW